MQISNIAFGTKLTLAGNASKLSNYNENLTDGILLAGELLNTNNDEDQFILHIKKTHQSPTSDVLEMTYIKPDERINSIAIKKPENLENLSPSQIALFLLNTKNLLKNVFEKTPLNLDQITTEEAKQQKINIIDSKYGNTADI